MLEAGGGFCLDDESVSDALGGPMAQANDFQRDGAIQTLLVRAKHHALPPRPISSSNS